MAQAHPRVPFFALFALALTAGMTGLAAQGDPAADYEKLRRGLETTSDAVAGLKAVADVASLTKPGKVVSELAKSLGTVADGAKAAVKVFDALDAADDAKAREKLLRENSKLPAWMQAALDPMNALRKIEAQIDAVEIPVFDSRGGGQGLSLADLQGDKAAATKKAKAQHGAHAAVVARLEEQVKQFTAIAERAKAAGEAMRALAEGWRKAYDLGCGVLGSYCGVQYLDADELGRQCSAIHSSAMAQKKKAERALKLEKTRLDNFVGNLRDLFGIDVTVRAPARRGR